LTKGAQQVPKLNYAAALDVTYSPFHGKFGVFDKKLSSFDLSLTAGLGLINADIDESLGNKAPVATMKVAGHWGAGLRFFLTRFLNVQVNYRQFLYQPVADAALLAPVEFTVGVAYLSK
jgi:outer membrane beta-barrel protein